jgi:hypothetical protein
MTPFKTSAQLADALIRTLEAAIESPDLSTLDAVHEIIDHEHAHGLDGLCRIIRHDPTDFILVAAPGFYRALKCATGHSRDTWAAVLPTT